MGSGMTKATDTPFRDEEDSEVIEVTPDFIEQEIYEAGGETAVKNDVVPVVDEQARVDAAMKKARELESDVQSLDIWRKCGNERDNVLKCFKDDKTRMDPVACEKFVRAFQRCSNKTD